MTAHHASFFEVALVVLFGLPEGSGRRDLSGDRLAEGAGGVEFGDLRPCLGCLLVGVGKDDAAVLRSPVRTLAIDLGGIVEREECVEKCLIGEAGRVKRNLNDFRVAGAVATDFLIGRVLEVSAFVS